MRGYKIIFSLITAISILTSGIDIKAKENNKLQDEIIETTRLFQELLQASYDNAEEDVKKIVSQNGYDYNATMESFYSQGNPFANLDYTTFIAAYCVAIANNSSSTKLYDISFIKIEYEEKTFEEEVPIQRDKYVLADDGETYEKDGFYYVTQSGMCNTHKEISPGKYVVDGVEKVELQKRDIPYAIVSLTPISIDELFNQLGLDMEEHEEEYGNRLYAIRHSGVTKKGLNESTFIKLANKDILNEEQKQIISNALNNSSGNEYTLVNTAVSLIGEVPYEWGGKSSKSGYDTSWWSFDDNGKQKGLDCSGYVQWVYRTSGYSQNVWSQLGSTSQILQNTEATSYEQLTYGDLGILNSGETTNHVGMYIGEGNFIHCSSGGKTVVINSQDDMKFRLFRKVKEKEETLEIPLATEYKVSSEDISNEDVELLAKLISHESKGEGLNGWIAVGEVVINRLQSDQFPNTIEKIVYQENKGIKQFANNEEIEYEKPSAEIYKTAYGILEGRLRILNNQNVLYFRNPGNNDSDWGNYPFYKRINNHVFYLNVKKGDSDT